MFVLLLQAIVMIHLERRLLRVETKATNTESTARAFWVALEKAGYVQEHPHADQTQHGRG